MSDINISDLYPANQPLSPLHEQSLSFEEIDLIKSATSRAIDTRKVVGGASNNFEFQRDGGMVKQF